jgi:cytochrome c biogenesis protein
VVSVGGLAKGDDDRLQEVVEGVLAAVKRRTGSPA